jgi:hypothetical protein
MRVGSPDSTEHRRGGPVALLVRLPPGVRWMEEPGSMTQRQSACHARPFTHAAHGEKYLCCRQAMRDFGPFGTTGKASPTP